MISSRLSPSIGPDHDFPSLGISMDHPLYFADDCFGTLLRDAQNPRRIERRCRPAVVDSDRLPHIVIIRRASWPSLRIRQRHTGSGATSVVPQARKDMEPSPAGTAFYLSDRFSTKKYRSVLTSSAKAFAAAISTE